MTVAPPPLAVDHLIVAGPRLDEATDYVEGLLGVRASPGGRHPGVGTRNVLVGLAPGAYVEIIAPDPEQPEPELPRWFGIDDLDRPRLVTWCARTAALETSRDVAAAAGADLGPIWSGGRVRADGATLSWRVTDPRADRFGGVLPFLIDWGSSEHPSSSLEASCELVALRAVHPEAARIRPVVDALGLPIELRDGSAARLESVLRTRGRLVTLR